MQIPGEKQNTNMTTEAGFCKSSMRIRAWSDTAIRQSSARRQVIPRQTVRRHTTGMIRRAAWLPWRMLLVLSGMAKIIWDISQVSGMKREMLPVTTTITWPTSQNISVRTATIRRRMTEKELSTAMMRGRICRRWFRPNGKSRDMKMTIWATGSARSVRMRRERKHRQHMYTITTKKSICFAWQLRMEAWPTRSVTYMATCSRAWPRRNTAVSKRMRKKTRERESFFGRQKSRGITISMTAWTVW